MHVIVYAFVFEMPQNRTYSFSVLSSFSNRSRGFLSKCPIFTSNPVNGRNGTFQDFRLQKNGALREKKHVINLKTRKDSKINIFDFGAFQKQMHIICSICHHVQNISSTNFLGHFKYPPVCTESRGTPFTTQTEILTQKVVRARSKSYKICNKIFNCA